MIRNGLSVFLFSILSHWFVVANICLCSFSICASHSSRAFASSFCSRLIEIRFTLLAFVVRMHTIYQPQKYEKYNVIICHSIKMYTRSFVCLFILDEKCDCKSQQRKWKKKKTIENIVWQQLIILLFNSLHFSISHFDFSFLSSSSSSVYFRSFHVSFISGFCLSENCRRWANKQFQI